MSTADPSPDSPAEQHQIVRRGLRLVAGFVRAQPLTFALSVIGTVAYAVGSVLSTVMLGWLTDDLVLPAFEEGSADRTRTYVVVAVLGVAVMRSGGVVVRRFFAGLTIYRTRSVLQRALGRHYLEMRPDDLRVAAKGRLLALVDSDTAVAVDSLGPLPFTIGVFTLLAVSIVALALIDSVVMLVAIALFPLIAVVNRFNIRATEAPALEVRERVGHMTGVAAESFDGALVVKTLGREDAELDRFSDESERVRAATVVLGRIRAIYASLTDLVPDIGVVVLVVVGASRVADGHMTTGQLVQAVALFGMLVFPLRVIGYFFGDLAPSVVAHGRIEAALARPQRIRTGHGQLGDGPLSVRAHDLTVELDEIAVVDCVDLAIEPGEVVALVGATGSGKSTLLRSFADMAPVSSGTVEVGGRSVDDIARLHLAGRVAMAWQEPFLLDASVRDNIVFGADVSSAEVERAVDIAQLADVLAGLPQGLDTLIGERGVRLSGGQRQRVALARAIVRRPGLLLLDDATSALDPIVEQRILDRLRTGDSTIVVVAHRRSTILLADRIAMLGEGRLQALGTHDQLAELAAYQSLLAAYDEAAVS